MHPALRETRDGVQLSLKVVPRASSNGWAGGGPGGELRLRVTAPPVDSAANGAVVEFVAESLGIPRRQVRILRGQTNPRKTLGIEGLPATEVARRLGLDG